MIKDAIERILEIQEQRVFEIYGEDYTNDPNMKRIAPHIDRPAAIGFSSLDAIVQAIRAELERHEITKPIFINVDTHAEVDVFTTYRSDNLQRDTLYTAKPDLPRPFNTWSEHDDAIIMLRSQFVPNEDVDYLLDLLSRLSSDDSVTTDDNGVTQKVSATTGVSLKTWEMTKTRVTLAPFRTFLEVDQPASEFILRIKQGDKDSGKPLQIGIIEADGGAWKLDAKAKIADYFRKHLEEQVTHGSVIVTE
jgi:hypothetical protein